MGDDLLYYLENTRIGSILYRLALKSKQLNNPSKLWWLEDFLRKY